MTNLYLTFKIHQPHRITNYSIFNVGKLNDYFIDQREIIEVLAKTCYIPATKLMLDLLNRHEGNYKFALCINGSTIELFEKYYPEIIENLKIIAQNENVEIVSETYNNSLSSLYSDEEFENQIDKNNNKIKKMFNIEPKIFMNTLGIYNEKIGKILSKKGFSYVIVNDKYFKETTKDNNFILIPYNNSLTNYIDHFSNESFKDYPINVEKFSKLIKDEKNTNLVLDFEIMGEYHRAKSGIFRFFDKMPDKILKNGKYILSQDYSKSDYENNENVNYDKVNEGIYSSLLKNKMQKEIIEEISLLPFDKIDKEILNNIGYLQDIGNLKNLCLNNFDNNSPYEHFINLKNILKDIKLKIEKKVEIIQKV